MTETTPDPGDGRIVRLDEVGMPRLLFALLRSRFTGGMEMTQPSPHDGKRHVWLRGGMPVFTDWVSPSDVLGQVLIDQRQISRADLDRALHAMVSGGHLLGDVLRQQNVLDHKQIAEGLRKQCERKLTHAFGLREGEVVLRPGDDLQHLPDLGQVNVLALVLRGVAKHFDEDDIVRAMGDALRGPLAASPAFARYSAQFGFRPGDAPAVEALARGTTLDELRDLPGTGRRRAAQLVFALWNCEMLELGERAAERRRQSESEAVPSNAHQEVSGAQARPRSRPRPDSGPRAPAAEASGARLEVFEVELQALEEKLARGAHAFDLLGVPPRAADRDIGRAYATISRRLDGTRVSSRRPDLADRAARVLEALGRANDLLAHVDERRELERLVAEEGTRHGLDALARAHTEGRSLERQADKLLQAGKISEALDSYRSAAALAGGKPEVDAAVAWCEYLCSGKNPEDAKRAGRALNKIVGRHSGCARAHYYRGMLLLALDNRAGALRSFTMACEADPRFTDAQRQVNALRSEGSSSRGRLGTLFRRK